MTHLSDRSYCQFSTRKWRARSASIVVIFLLALLKIIFMSSSYPDSGEWIVEQHGRVGRHLLSTDKSTNPSSSNSTTTASSSMKWNCTPLALSNFPRDQFTQNQRRKGVLLLHIFVALYMFMGLALACDEYFVPSLEGICNTLHLQADVAGATFMAAGSSAPELATTVIGVFIAQDDIGLSAVVGSADYNIMFVISMCALCARSVIYLNWWPLVRDSSVYCISIIALALIIYDERVFWYEAASFLVLYAFYIVLMWYNRPLERYFLRKFPNFGAHPPHKSVRPTPVGVCFPHASAPAHAMHHFHDEVALREENCDEVPLSSAVVEIMDEDGLEDEHETVWTRTNAGFHNDRSSETQQSHSLLLEDERQIQTFRNKNSLHSAPQTAILPESHETVSRGSPIPSAECPLLHSDEGDFLSHEVEDRELAREESCLSVLSWPTRMSAEEFAHESMWSGCCSVGYYHMWNCVLHCLTWPLKLVLSLTVPDCRLQRWRRWFWITFLMSCLWISALSYIMIWMISVIGYTLGIPDTVMALTFVAAGSSVPDALASVMVVREGQGDMAVSNAVGSNVFDILVCMGLPWLCRCLFTASHVTIYSRGLLYATFTLLSTVFILLVSTHVNGWRLTRGYGVWLLVVYCLYLGLCTLYELNVFGLVHLPECPLRE